MIKKIVILLCGIAFNSYAANFSEGLRLYDAGDYTGAFAIWQELAQKGQANAQHNLGIMYEKGLGVAKNDKTALNWFKKAAEQGHAKSQYILGTKYFYGDSQPQDYAQAIYWWEKATKQNIISAGYNLGVLYLYADDKFKNEALAHKWLKQAAAAGHEKAKAELVKLGIKEQIKDKKKAKAKTPAQTRPKDKKPAKKYRPKNWLASQNPNHYTIQLAVAGSKKKALALIKKHRLKNKIHFYKIKNKKIYKIITGSYKTSAKAQQAIRRLPAKLRKQGPWPKKFRIIQQEMSGS